MVKSHLRIVSDIHGYYAKYHKMIKQCEYSVQLGDMGFSYSTMDHVGENHKLIAGNHDNYDKLCKHHLGDFGTYNLGGVDFFYVRGGFSLDRKWRRSYEISSGEKIYWPNEQLTMSECAKTFELYKKIKPQLMLTHSCPKSIADIIGNPKVLEFYEYDPKTFTTQTQELLQKCFDYHRPNLWVFGHFHKDFSEIVNDTIFCGLGIENYVDLDKNGDII